MITYRVTHLVRHHDGTDHAQVYPIANRAEAYRYAAELRAEDPTATVDVVAIGERGEYVPDAGRPEHKTRASDEAMVDVFDQWETRRRQIRVGPGDAA